MAIHRETELYVPVKAFLERLGYEVRGEVRHCDLVAVRDGEAPVIVELKRSFNLPLLVQAVDRLKHTDRVYVAVEMPANGRAPHGLAWSDLSRLCRMLGLGLMTVRFYKRKLPAVDVLCEPGPYGPRRSKKAALLLMNEFRERSGDYNIGGSSRRKLVTAYREKALQCAYFLHLHGPLSTRRLRELTGNGRAAGLLQKNYYRWFRRVKTGVYELTPLGEDALMTYAHVIRDWNSGRLSGAGAEIASASQDDSGSAGDPD
jgi:hypothetical protein